MSSKNIVIYQAIWYNLSITTSREVAMDALEMLLNRRAIRKFKPDPVPADLLDKILECGTYAPSAKGTQSSLIVAVQDRETVSVLNRINAKYSGGRYEVPYYGSPAIILVFATDRAESEDRKYINAANVCCNMANAAYALGLSTCWIHRCREMFEDSDGKALLEKWGITENVYGVASLALGYADCEYPAPAPRREGYIKKV